MSNNGLYNVDYLTHRNRILCTAHLQPDISYEYHINKYLKDICSELASLVDKHLDFACVVSESACAIHRSLKQPHLRSFTSKCLCMNNENTF
jgi:hypothetical protein